VVEARLVNPLARAVFDGGMRDRHVTVRRLYEDEAGVAQAELT
jgi:hypothetical protein